MKTMVKVYRIRPYNIDRSTGKLVHVPENNYSDYLYYTDRREKDPSQKIGEESDRSSIWISLDSIFRIDEYCFDSFDYTYCGLETETEEYFYYDGTLENLVYESKCSTEPRGEIRLIDK